MTGETGSVSVVANPLILFLIDHECGDKARWHAVTSVGRCFRIRWETSHSSHVQPMLLLSLVNNSAHEPPTIPWPTFHPRSAVFLPQCYFLSTTQSLQVPTAESSLFWPPWTGSFTCCASFFFFFLLPGQSVKLWAGDSWIPLQKTDGGWWLL